MPYRERYAVSGSGVFYEALQLERFVIVPETTFMHQVLTDFDYPCAFLPAVTSTAATRCILTLLKNKRQLRQKMLDLHARQGEMLPTKKFRELVADGFQESDVVQ